MTDKGYRFAGIRKVLLEKKMQRQGGSISGLHGSHIAHLVVELEYDLQQIHGVIVIHSHHFLTGYIVKNIQSARRW